MAQEATSIQNDVAALIQECDHTSTSKRLQCAKQIVKKAGQAAAKMLMESLRAKMLMRKYRNFANTPEKDAFIITLDDWHDIEQLFLEGELSTTKQVQSISVQDITAIYNYTETTRARLEEHSWCRRQTNYDSEMIHFLNQRLLQIGNSLYNLEQKFFGRPNH